MASANIGQAVAYSLLTVANLFNSLKITSVSVPEVVQTSGVAILDCEYTVNDDRFVVRWLLNGALVYEWRPHTEPVVNLPLLGHLDNVAISDEFERRTLRIIDPAPELSGDYSCVVRGDDGAEDRRTKSMQVFSPEHEFALTIDHKAEVEINCIARGLYPQPHLILELNRETVGQHAQRVWRNGSLYDAATSARLPLRSLRRTDVVTCRLQLPTAGYSAMRDTHFHLEELKLQKFKYLCSENTNSTEDICRHNAAAETILHRPNLVLVLISMICPVLYIKK